MLDTKMVLIVSVVMVGFAVFFFGIWIGYYLRGFDSKYYRNQNNKEIQD
jgi:VIT1/CCC1 family predicted Fe2+/Mn2+ transporter